MDKEYASKSQANLNTVLGALGTVGAVGGGNVLGNLFGCGSGGSMRAAGALAEGQLCASLMAEVGQLKAEKYADKNTADVFVALNAQNNALRDKLADIQRWQAAEIAAAPLREQLLRQRLELVEFTLRRITSIGVPNGVLVPGVPPVAIIHQDAAVSAVPA